VYILGQGPGVCQTAVLSGV